MSDFFSRMGNLIKGAAENFIKGMEEDNPEAVIQAALEGHTRRIGELSGQITLLQRRIENGERERSTLQAEQLRLEQEAARWVGLDEPKALELLELKARLDEKASALQTRLADDEAQLARMQETLEETRAAHDKLKRERDGLLVQYHSHKQAAEQSALDSGIPRDASSAALLNVREQVAKAEGVVKRAVDEREARRKRAQEELEALKRQSSSGNAGEPTSRSLEGGASPSAGSSAAPAASPNAPSEPSPVPKRTL